MSERITKADLSGALTALTRAASACGIDTEGWSVQTGSKTYGNSWQLYRLTESHGHANTGLPMFLGWSNREAYDKLQAYKEALYLAAESTEKTIQQLRTKLANTENSLVLATDHGLRAW